jgi:hypothetical protein
VGKVLVDFTMPRYRLTRSRLGVLIPVVPPSMAQQDTAAAFQSTDEIDAFHAIRNSATRRTPGIRPLVNSS